MSREQKKTLWIWGNGTTQNTETGIASPPVSCVPVLQLQEVDVKYLSIGKACGTLITEDEKCYQVGKPGTRELTLSGIEATLREVSTLKSHQVTKVNCGYHHIAVLTTPGNAFCWGVSNYGQCGVRTDVVSEPRVIKIDKKQNNVIFTSIACGKNHTMAVSSNCDLWGWGLSHLTGTCNALRHAVPSPHPEIVEYLSGRKVLQVSCGKYHTAVLTEKIMNQDTSMSRTSLAICKYCKEEIYKMHDSEDQVIISDTHICNHAEHPHGVLKENRRHHEKPKLPTHSRSASLPFFKLNSPLLAKKERMSRTPPSLAGHSFPLSNSSSSNSLNSLKYENLKVTDENFELTSVAKHDSKEENTLMEKSRKQVKPDLESIKVEELHKARTTSSLKSDQTPPGLCTSAISKSSSFPADLWKQKNDQSTSEVPHFPCKIISDSSSSYSNTSQGSSSLSLTSLDECKSRMTVPPSTDDLNLDPESAITYLNHLSPNGGRDALDSSELGNESLTNVEELEKIKETGNKKSISEKITQSIADNQLLSPLTLYSKNVFTGVMDHFEWIKASTYDKGVAPIRDFLSKDKMQLDVLPDESEVSDEAQDDPLRSSEQVSNEDNGKKRDLVDALTLHTEVWTWGENTHGQLGLSDRLDRFQPMCINTLSSRGIVKIACGAHHTVVLTSNSEAYSWGNNEQGQLGRSDRNASNPVKVECENRIWDIATGRHHSLFLVDAASDEPVVLSCGNRTGGRKSTLDPLTMNEIGGSSKNKLRPVEFSHEMGYTFAVISGFSTLSSCLSEKKCSRARAAIYNFARAEREFYQDLTLIKVELLRPLKYSDLFKHIDGSCYADILSRTIDLFGKLSYDIGLSILHITRAVTSGAVCKEETFSFVGDDLMQSYQRYFKSLNDMIAFGFFEKCEAVTVKHAKVFSKPKILQIFKTLLSDKRLSKLPSENFLQILQLPASRMREYVSIFNRLAVASEEEVELCTFLENLSARWEDLWNIINNQLRPANDTRAFWKNEFKAGSGVKLAESLKKVGRYVVAHSKKVPLDIAYSGRFSTNWFILFNDCLVLLRYGTHVEYPLKTLWCTSMPDPKERSHLIKIVTPEDEIIAIAPNDESKAKWINSFNHTINNIVNNTATFGSPSRGSMQYHRSPSSVRYARHTFTKDVDLKGGTYNGSWLNGKPHGKGEMSWADGRKYTGSYKNGKEDGYGEWSAAPGDSSKLKYHGWWKEGKMNGYGKLWYNKYQAYEGSFESGVREGHGVLRTGSITEGSVYVGSWKKDERSKYGVEDNITKAEKYLGMWSNDQRQGVGILVTLDGLYGQGRFSHGEMSGNTLLIEGRYIFEGHVSAGMVLNGKGRLTLPTGDKLEGSFSGPWGDNIRVSGNLMRFEQAHSKRPESPKTPVETINSQMPQRDYARSILRRYNRHIMKKHVDSKHAKSFPLSLHPDLKWTEIFAKCRSSMACPLKSNDVEGTNIRKVWEAVSVAMSNTKRMREELKHSPSKKSDEIRIGWLERVPTIVTEYKEGSVTHDEIISIKEYLSQAFAASVHPLGDLVESLGNVFRDCYSGAGAQKWLLMQALADIRSFVRRTYDILRFMFPQLSKEHGVSHMKIMRSRPEMDNSDDSKNAPDETVTGGDLVLPVILPRVYPTLFTLYALHHESEDALYWERVTRLNRHPDVALLSYLGVKPKFWLLDEKEIPPLESLPENGQLYGSVDQAESSKWRHLLVATAKDCSFLNAVETLQRISTTFIPSEKLNVIHSTFKEINSTVLDRHKLTHTWSMDDLFPVFQYVVIRSRINHLGCEIQLIEDFLEPDMCKGEKGIMFTTLKACYFQIRVEKDM